MVTFGIEDCLRCLLLDGLFFCKPLAGNEAKYSFRATSNRQYSTVLVQYSTVLVHQVQYSISLAQYLCEVRYLHEYIQLTKVSVVRPQTITSITLNQI